MTLHKTIKHLREKANLSQKEVAKRAYTRQSYISKIEAGGRVPSMRMLEDILVKGIGLPYEKTKKIVSEWKLEKIGLPKELATLVNVEFVLAPVLGSVPCGDPREEIEEAEDHIILPKHLIPKNHCIFAMKAEGLSMIEDILPGDTIICDVDAKVKDGDLAIVRLDDKVTLKRIYFHKGYAELQPANKGFDSIKVKNLDIVGKVIHLIKSYP